MQFSTWTLIQMTLIMTWRMLMKMTDYKWSQMLKQKQGEVVALTEENATKSFKTPHARPPPCHPSSVPVEELRHILPLVSAKL